MYIERQLTSTLTRALGAFPAVLLTGPRQSGKTTLARVATGDAQYATLDDPVTATFARDDPEGFLTQFQSETVILDEIQYAPELLRSVKIRIDRERSRYGRWLLTGSQQFELMHNITETLAGRVAILDLPPLSYAEQRTVFDGSLAELIWRGGYPEPFLAPAARDLWLASYLRTYLERDVRTLLRVTDLRAFETFLALSAAQHSQLVNYARLARDSGVSQPTIKSWLSVLSASFVLYTLQPLHENLGKRLVRSPKLYFLDSALVCALTRQPAANAALAGAMGGALFEGFVVIEAVKAFMAAGKRPPLFFWRSHDGLEVDLIIEAGGKWHPVEIKKTASPTTGHVTGLTKFCALAGERATQNGTLVCTVPEECGLAGGHRAMPWHRFSDWVGALA